MINRTEFKNQLAQVTGTDDGLKALSFQEIVSPIPKVDQLRREPARSTVLVRAELDLPIRDGQVSDPSRIETSLATFKHCLDRGWKVVLLGHIGRDPDLSLKPVCDLVSQRLGKEVEFLDDWLDSDRSQLDDSTVRRIQNAPRRSLFMLQNARKYEVERALWNPQAPTSDLPDRLFDLASDIRNRLADTEINEAIAASNTDFSSSVVPLLMRQTALGLFLHEEMTAHIPQASSAKFVVFSGQKMNKLDDLEAMIVKRDLELVIVAGALSMPLLKAQAQISGGDFYIGLAQEDNSLKTFVSQERLGQAHRIVKAAKSKLTRLVLPADFVLDDGVVAKRIGKRQAQMDIGPETRSLFQAKTREYIAEKRRLGDPGSMFFNGVFGKFEDRRFESGTKSFIPLLRELTEAGISTYVGGGEGRLALTKYGDLEDVTHAFTCGGTVLKCLAGKQIGYLRAMHLQNTKKSAATESEVQFRA